MIAEGSKFLGRTCAECLTFQWSDEGIEGTTATSRKKYPTVQACLDAGAVPRKRIPLTITPCYECPKVREGAPAASYYYADEITDQTWATISHFDECDAVGQFPDDAICRKNAAIIRRIRDGCKRAEDSKGMAYLISLLGFGATASGHRSRR